MAASGATAGAGRATTGGAADGRDAAVLAVSGLVAVSPAGDGGEGGCEGAPTGLAPAGAIGAGVAVEAADGAACALALPAVFPATFWATLPARFPDWPPDLMPAPVAGACDAEGTVGSGRPAGTGDAAGGAPETVPEAALVGEPDAALGASPDAAAAAGMVGKAGAWAGWEGGATSVAPPDVGAALAVAEDGTVV
ncbi:hypothetical protein [Pannonibacter carbonis]|uniref:hypothetical protein n=1 Tax=Pannonibacter carbonis TaxID=2067569 RepID=UPI000D0F820F|nr:hypothetical protein [Pannonibacter carbonis]